MDPKSIANLDPKLRETYERVMGATATTSSLPTNQGDLSSSNTSVSSTPVNNDFFTDTQPNTSPQTIETPTPSASDALLSPTLSSQPVQPMDMPQQQNVLSSIQVGTPSIPTNSTFQSPPQPLTPPASAIQATQAQDTGPLIRLLYIFGGIVFFVVYVFFWIKIFNYKLPF